MQQVWTFSKCLGKSSRDFKSCDIIHNVCFKNLILRASVSRIDSKRKEKEQWPIGGNCYDPRDGRKWPQRRGNTKSGKKRMILRYTLPVELTGCTDELKQIESMG